jgi:hypothetical protein
VATLADHYANPNSGRESRQGRLKISSFELTFNGQMTPLLVGEETIEIFPSPARASTSIRRRTRRRDGQGR